MTEADEDALRLSSEDVPVLAWDEKTQSYVIDPEKAGVTWNYLVVKYNNSYPIALTSGQDVIAAAYVPPDAPNELESLMLTSDGRVAIRVTLEREGKKHNLSNVMVASNLLCGNAQYQAEFNQTSLLKPGDYATVRLRDLSNASNNVSPVFRARRFGSRTPSKEMDAVGQFSRWTYPYVLGPSQGTLTPSGGTAAGVAGGPEIVLAAGATVDLRFDPDASFDCNAILDDSTLADNVTPPNSNLTAQVYWGDMLLMSDPISWRDFVARPTSAITGFQKIGGFAGISAAALPREIWTMFAPKRLRPRIVFKNNYSAGAANAITLRVGFGGTAVVPELSKRSA